MNYICFMFQTAIVSAGLFSAENSYIHFITQRPLPFYFFPLHIPVTKPDFRYLRSNRNT